MEQTIPTMLMMFSMKNKHVHPLKAMGQAVLSTEEERGSLGSVQQKLQVQRNPDLTNRATGKTPASVSGLHICAQVCTSHILIDVASALL